LRGWRVQVQAVGGEGAGGFDSAGELVAQGEQAGGGQRLVLALRFQLFSVSACCFLLVAGLFDAVFHSQPVEQRALNLLLREVISTRVGRHGNNPQDDAFSLITERTYGWPVYWSASASVSTHSSG
jgi:hypothetical protein